MQHIYPCKKLYVISKKLLKCLYANVTHQSLNNTLEEAELLMQYLKWVYKHSGEQPFWLCLPKSLCSRLPNPLLCFVLPSAQLLLWFVLSAQSAVCHTTCCPCSCHLWHMYCRLATAVKGHVLFWKHRTSNKGGNVDLYINNEDCKEIGIYLSKNNFGKVPMKVLLW